MVELMTAEVGKPQLDIFSSSNHFFE